MLSIVLMAGLVGLPSYSPASELAERVEAIKADPAGCYWFGDDYVVCLDVEEAEEDDEEINVE